MSACRFCQRRDLTRTLILEDCVWERGRGNVCHDKGEHLGVSGLGTEVLPVFCTHSQRTRFAEAWHTLQGVGEEFCDLEDKDVCDLVVQWDGRVGVYWVEAFNILDDVSGDRDWWIVSCCC